VKRFVSSGAYVRTRAITGIIFAVCGLALLINAGTAVAANGWRIVPVVVMGLALVALGGLRVRDYLRWRKSA
jgi:hypothetical protein